MTTQAIVRRVTAAHVTIHFGAISLAEAKPGTFAIGARVERRWLALVCCPLAMIAATLGGLWFALPVLVIASWWWTPSWRWAWVRAAEEGLFGAQWAFVGAKSLAAFRDQLPTVGVIWIGAPAVLVIEGLWKRWRASSPSGVLTGRALPRNGGSAIGDDVVS